MAAPRATMISSRRRPLHTCVSSMLGIIDTAYRRSQQLDGPLGNFTKRLTTFASSAFPYAPTMQRIGLIVLSITDDHILFFEQIAESVFPPSGRVFDKIDMIVYSAEGLPSRFDEALNNIPLMMHQIPFLDWVLMHVIWWLNFLISILNHWGSRHATEKEIMIDKRFDPCYSPIESPKKMDSSGEAQEQSKLRIVEFIESPVKANSTESADTKNLDEAGGRSMVGSNESVESTDKENVDEAWGQSMVSSNEFVGSTDKEILDEARGQSMVGSNEFVDSGDDEQNIDETRGQSLVSNNEFVESTDKGNVDEARGQSMVDDGNKFVESTDQENVEEVSGHCQSIMTDNNEFAESPDSVETQEKSMLSDSEEEPSSTTYPDLEEKPTEEKEEEKINVQSPNTEESENNAEDDQEHPQQHEDDQEHPQHEDQTNTTVSPTESFQSAQFEHIISPSATSDSFHEAKSFENIELPTTDEDETKERSLSRGSSSSVNKPGNEKSSPTTTTTTTTATSSSSGNKNKGKGKKTTRKDEQKIENKAEDQHKILELLEAKWHMM